VEKAEAATIAAKTRIKAIFFIRFPPGKMKGF
jgi:hypothetical protein